MVESLLLICTVVYGIGSPATEYTPPVIVYCCAFISNGRNNRKNSNVYLIENDVLSVFIIRLIKCISWRLILEVVRVWLVNYYRTLGIVADSF